MLSGGSGERLWPLSRAQRPKQLLSLATERTMLQETAARVAAVPLCAAPMVIANDTHRFLVAEQLQQMGAAARRIVLEPAGRNTAPAAAVAALFLSAEDPEALMALIPSDHVVQDKAAFAAAMEKAHAAALAGALTTFGISPSRPETGYGYIRPGKTLPAIDGAYRVAAFVEKPDLAAAEAYLAAGDHYWNSGIFVFSARRYLEELERQRPDILAACHKALDGASQDRDFLHLDPAAFAACPSESIDYAVMERSEHTVVIPCDMGWSDVGAWNALWEITEKDAAGNAFLGNCMTQDVEGSYLRSEDGRLIAAIGLEDMVVISTEDAVFVAPRDNTMAVRGLVKRLKDAGRQEATRDLSASPRRKGAFS
ncbi:mannose-1-phosphate guanylyltransferase/mannose-6-phosphate isomerase [Pelagibius litoralis]|uniref:mannose-1-phosphate guanylyltransferase/mannose-6-phosphate isomerase n=1 Tax=Pelagibius litoralis TaxID=374515 RepID=UPI002AC33D65|nr:mannose-1-phosphate guanylyltransferase/mannose-6-phosphate isomerase [Pelagibius litoralis]